MDVTYSKISSMGKKFKLFTNVIIMVLVISVITGTVYGADTEISESAGSTAATSKASGSTENTDRITASAGDPISGEGIAALAQTDLVTDTNGDQIYSYGDGYSVTAPSAIVMDMDSGQVLYGKNIFTSRYPASITKVLTGLICTENGSPEDIVTFDEETVYSIEAGSACAGMLIGEQITLDQCLRCMMAQSANECAYGAGKTVAGSMEAFVDMMNEVAASLGCVNSNFVNPHGLHDDNHYTCAYDMALIASAAYQNDWFRDICHLETYNRPLTEMNPENAWVMYNRHQMFHPDSQYYYEYVTGGKTGYTDQARTTLVTYAEKDGRRLVVVVMNCAGVEVYTSTRGLFDYGFDNFTNYKVSELVDPDVVEELENDFTVTLPLNADKTDIGQLLNTNDEKHARITFMYKGRELGASNCTLTKEYTSYLNRTVAKDIPSDEDLTVNVEDEDFHPEEYHINYLFVVIAAAVVLILTLIIVLLVRLNKKRKKLSYATMHAEGRSNLSDTNKTSSDNSQAIPETDNETKEQQQ